MSKKINYSCDCCQNYIGSVSGGQFQENLQIITIELQYMYSGILRYSVLHFCSPLCARAKLSKLEFN